MKGFEDYFNFALDRVEAAGPVTRVTLTVQVEAMRDAADQLERRACGLPAPALLDDGVAEAISQPRGLL